MLRTLCLEPKHNQPRSIDMFAISTTCLQLILLSITSESPFIVVVLTQSLQAYASWWNNLGHYKIYANGSLFFDRSMTILHGEYVELDPS